MSRENRRFLLTKLLVQIWGVKCYQGSNLQLVGYSDANWGSDLDERKLTSGYVSLLIMVPLHGVARNNPI
jgi:hypothetical protein